MASATLALIGLGVSIWSKGESNSAKKAAGAAEDLVAVTKRLAENADATTRRMLERESPGVRVEILECDEDKLPSGNKGATVSVRVLFVNNWKAVEPIEEIEVFYRSKHVKVADQMLDVLEQKDGAFSFPALKLSALIQPGEFLELLCIFLADEDFGRSRHKEGRLTATFGNADPVEVPFYVYPEAGPQHFYL